MWIFPNCLKGTLDAGHVTKKPGALEVPGFFMVYVYFGRMGFFGNPANSDQFLLFGSGPLASENLPFPKLMWNTWSTTIGRVP